MTLRLQPLALDRAGERQVNARSAFLRARKVETRYATMLRRIARHVGHIVQGFDAEDFAGLHRAKTALERYAEVLTPWAESVAQRMVTEIAARDEQAWRKASAEIGKGIAREIAEAPTGAVMRRLMAEQVTLIKSLPLEAAERVHKLAVEGLANGSRASELAAEIMRSGEVAKSRANLIARTETGRAQTTLTQARAQSVGSTHFRWVTAHDSDVRPSHKKLDGKIFRWDDPPECDPGHHALPGAIWNCRCVAIPILPDEP